MKLASILPAEAVVPPLAARDKKQAIKQLATLAARLTGISERDIYAALMEREGAACTGMGGGICIPHARFGDLKTPHAFFIRLDPPVPFGAPDGKPVDLIFLLLSPTSANTEHIKALATMSRLMRDKRLCDNLRSTANATVLHDLLIVAAQEAA